MKKSMMILTIGLLLFALTSGVVFADAPMRGQASGVQLQQSIGGSEEALELKMARIDALLDAGRINQDQAESFKQMMSERMNDCIGMGRGEKAPMSIGFGRMNRGMKNQYGQQ